MLLLISALILILKSIYIFVFKILHAMLSPPLLPSHPQPPCIYIYFLICHCKKSHGPRTSSCCKNREMEQMNPPCIPYTFPPISIRKVSAGRILILGYCLGFALSMHYRSSRRQSVRLAGIHPVTTAELVLPLSIFFPWSCLPHMQVAADAGGSLNPQELQTLKGFFLDKMGDW